VSGKSDPFKDDGIVVRVFVVLAQNKFARTCAHSTDMTLAAEIRLCMRVVYERPPKSRKKEEKLGIAPPYLVSLYIYRSRINTSGSVW